MVSIVYVGWVKKGESTSACQGKQVQGVHIIRLVSEIHTTNSVGWCSYSTGGRNCQGGISKKFPGLRQDRQNGIVKDKGKERGRHTYVSHFCGGG